MASVPIVVNGLSSGIDLKFIGIEIDKGYMDIARKRIEYWVDIQPVDIFKDAG